MFLQSWHQTSCKIFRLARLRFRLNFFPGSHHLPWQLNCTTRTWSSSKTKTQELEHQDMNIPAQNHVQYNQVQSNTTSTQSSTSLHDVSLRSVSNSKFWMPSRTLLSPSSLRGPWKLWITSTNTQHDNMFESIRFNSRHNASFTMLSKLLSQDSSIPSCSNQHSPPFKLALGLWTQAALCAQMSTAYHPATKRVNLELAKTTPRRKDSQLFSRFHKRCIWVPSNSMVQHHT